MRFFRCNHHAVIQACISTSGKAPSDTPKEELIANTVDAAIGSLSRSSLLYLLSTLCKQYGQFIATNLCDIFEKQLNELEGSDEYKLNKKDKNIDKAVKDFLKTFKQKLAMNNSTKTKS